mmetsp:Transcript_22191/g.46813  ORF Transcript_22191/g.46813 Transcript_22191/m.46813 type:complete len:83 (-) Transcript_22191:24-272(-)
MRHENMRREAEILRRWQYNRNAPGFSASKCSFLRRLYYIRVCRDCKSRATCDKTLPGTGATATTEKESESSNGRDGREALKN